MIPLPKTAKANELVSSIYQICVFGNGTVNDRDKRLVRMGMLPSYMQAKWFHFNHFGLNSTKVENTFIMFFAKSSVITLDLLFMIPAIATGTEEFQAVNVVIDFAKLIVVPVASLALQEYLERTFNSQMFQEKNPSFLNVGKEIEGFIVQKHTDDITLSDGHLNILKKFTALPLLNYIFFYYQMTEEYINYRESYSKKENVNFKDQNVVINYFKTSFRMLRFYQYTEVHALNYYFSHTFGNILNFYINFDCIRNKYMSVFYSEKKFKAESDIKYFLSILNHKIQTQQKRYRIESEICVEAFEQFQHFYFQFFFPDNINYENLIKFLDSSEIKKIIKGSYDDTVLGKAFYTITKAALLEKSASCIGEHVATPALNKSKDFLSVIFGTLTNVSGSEKNQKILGSVTIVGLTALVGAIVAGAVVAYKHQDKIESFVSRLYEKVASPAIKFVEDFENKISELFSLNSVALHSEGNRVFGSVLYVISHIPGASILSPITQALNSFSSFNPISESIIRAATEYTNKRSQEKEIEILNTVDKLLRLGYTEDGILTIKILTQDNTWLSDFNIDYINKKFLVFMTSDFARVARHQSQSIGNLFEQISILDKEIQSFDNPPHSDFFYCRRDKTGPVYLFPPCRVTIPITPEMIESRSKQRFFDILIERQNLMINLINRAYYVTLYNLFVTKIKAKCKTIFMDDLPSYIEKLDDLS